MAEARRDTKKDEDEDEDHEVVLPHIPLSTATVPKPGEEEMDMMELFTLQSMINVGSLDIFKKPVEITELKYVRSKLSRLLFFTLERTKKRQFVSYFEELAGRCVRWVRNAMNMMYYYNTHADQRFGIEMMMLLRDNMASVIFLQNMSRFDQETDTWIRDFTKRQKPRAARSVAKRKLERLFGVYLSPVITILKEFDQRWYRLNVDIVELMSLWINLIDVTGECKSPGRIYFERYIRKMMVKLCSTRGGTDTFLAVQHVLQKLQFHVKQLRPGITSVATEQFPVLHCYFALSEEKFRARMYEIQRENR